MYKKSKYQILFYFYSMSFTTLVKNELVFVCVIEMQKHFLEGFLSSRSFVEPTFSHRQLSKYHGLPAPIILLMLLLYRMYLVSVKDNFNKVFRTLNPISLYTYACKILVVLSCIFVCVEDDWAQVASTCVIEYVDLPLNHETRKFSCSGWLKYCWINC